MRAPHVVIALVLAFSAGCGGRTASQSCSEDRPCTVAIASGLSVPSYLAVDSTNVYWTDEVGATVNKAPTGGGAVTTLAAGGDSFEGLGVDATSVYWTTHTTVSRVATAGGTPALLDPHTVNASGLALDSSSVYFFEDEGVLNRVALQGGIPGQLAVVQIPQSLAVDASNVYWTQYPEDGPSGVTGNVMQMPKAGGPQTVLASGHRLGSIAVDATSVYWVDFDGSAVNRVPIGGGDTVTLATGSMGDAIVVDGVSVYYWITDSGSAVGVLTKIPIAGGEPTTLASGVQGPGAIAVDATSVYWIAGAGVPPSAAQAAGSVMKRTPK
jgi:hypothetical protein